MKSGVLALISALLVVNVVHGFKDLNDGARIDNTKSLESYSIPLRNQRRSSTTTSGNQGTGERIAGVLSKFDDDEYTLISRMKTMETPPSPDAVDHYASNKHVGTRFTNQQRTKRSLKFDDNSNSKPLQAPPSDTQQRSTYSGGAVQFGHDSSEKSSTTTGDNKRFLPELFGIQSPPYYGGSTYGHHGGLPPPHYNSHHHYNPGYYPGGGAGNYYPPPNYGGYGNGYYPGAYQPYYPGGAGHGGSSASAAAAAASSSSNQYRPGLYGNGYYGGGYGNGYIPNGGISPILSPVYPGGGFLGGFFRDEDGNGGKVSGGSAIAGGTGDRVKGSVSFEK